MTLASLLATARVIAATSDGFAGTFVFDPAHTEDRGIGHIGDFVDFDDRLMYVPQGGDVRDHDESHEIACGIEQHIAEPMAALLNGAGQLARAVLDLLAEAAPCGWDAPRFVDATPGLAIEAWVSVPEQWTGLNVSSDDARAFARMLFAVADEADARIRATSAKETSDE